MDALEKHVSDLKTTMKDLQAQLQQYREIDQTERACIVKTLQEVRSWQLDTASHTDAIKCKTSKVEKSNNTTAIKRPRLTITTQPFERSAAIPIPKKGKRIVKSSEVVSPSSISPPWYPISDEQTVSAL